MLLGAVGVIEFRGQDKSMFRPRKVFGNKYARPKYEGKRKIFAETCKARPCVGFPNMGILSRLKSYHFRGVSSAAGVAKRGRNYKEKQTGKIHIHRITLYGRRIKIGLNRIAVKKKSGFCPGQSRT